MSNNSAAKAFAPETLSLTEAIGARAPDGALFHATCLLFEIDGMHARLADGSSQVNMPIEQSKSTAARGLVGSEIVATVLKRRDGRWRVIAMRSRPDFDRWWATRGDGETVDRMFEEHRDMFDLLREAFPA